MGGDGEDVGMHVVRDVLEALVEPAVAAKAIFEALDEPDAGGVPQDAESVMTFARGPLARRLEQRVGSEVVSALLAKLDSAVHADHAIEVDIELAFDDDAPDAATRLVRSSGGPVKVAVVAGAGRFVRPLTLALGPQRVAATPVRDVGSIGLLAGALAPDVVIVDGADAPAGSSPDEVARCLAALNPTPLLLIWCADTPWAGQVSTALSIAGASFTSVPQTEGVGPLLDYIRSRAEE